MSELIQQILEQIRLESKKNPLTDLELSKILMCERAYVTKVRKQNKIPSRNERYKKYLMQTIVESSPKKAFMDEDQMIKLLNEKGFTLSRYMSKELLKDMNSSKNKKTRKTEINEQEGFEELVGAVGSLKNAIRLVQSSIVFSESGLPSLLIGERGVGKWTIAKLMYLYGKNIGRFQPTMEFQDIHCADYKENPEELKKLLLEVLKKNQDNEKPDQGLFIFLEDVDLLPVSCKELLFDYLETYSNPGSHKIAGMFLVGATTKSYVQSQENRLLSSFSIKIQLPNLENRSLEERLELITRYLKKQSKKLDKSIVISKDALSAFLLYQPKGNITGLLADLQMSTVRSFSSDLAIHSDALHIDLDAIGEDVKKGLLQTSANREMTHNIIPAQGLRIDRNAQRLPVADKKEIMESNIYQLINKEYEKHQKEEYSKQLTRNGLGKRIEEIISNNLMESDESKTTLEDIQNLVGETLVQAVQEAMEHTQVLFQSYSQRLFNSITLHISETMKRIQRGRRLVVPNLDYVHNSYPLEYEVALNMMETLETRLDVRFPVEEAAYITLYLKGFMDPSLGMTQIGILVITHGDYGSRMVELAQQLMGAVDTKIQTIEMPLEKEIDDIYDQAVKHVQELNQGKGVLIMVDMGSLNALTHMITQDTGVPIASVDRIDILLLMEAIRLCSRAGMTIHELNILLKELKSGYSLTQNYRKQGFRTKKMIITTCLTGEGSALFLKEQLGKAFKSQDVEILALGVFSTQGLFEKIVQLKKTYDILFITGTVDPKVPDIDFVFLDDIIKKETIEKMKKKYFSFRIKDRWLKMDKSIMFVNKALKDKLDVVTYLCKKVVEYGYTNEHYLNSVLDRMALAPLNMLDGSEKGIAVIHTASFDDVLKPGLAVLTLSEAILWDQIYVDVVFVLMVKDSSMQIPMEFHTSIVTNETIMNNIRAARNKNELFELLNRRGPI